MIEARKSELAAALRSGMYSQGRQQLRGPDGYCCLGVACEISGLGRWEYAKEESAAHHNNYCVGLDCSWEWMVPQVAEYFGFAGNKGDIEFNSGDDEIQRYGNRTSLADLNDEYKLTFPEIADFIEKHWERL